MNQRSSSDAKVQPLRDRLKAATSTAILDAAEEVVAEQGIAGASLHAVAERAGVAVGTIYNYFADRDELFRALFLRRRQEIAQLVETATKETAKEPFEVQLRSFVKAVLGAFDDRRRYLRIALEVDQTKAKIGHPDDKKVMQAMSDRANQIVHVGVRAKLLRSDGAELFPFLLTSMIKGVLLARLDAEKPFSADADRVVDLFLHGASR